MMDPAQARRASAEGYLAAVVMHEIAHGLGPAFARQGRQPGGHPRGHRPACTRDSKRPRPTSSGCSALKWLIDHGVLPQESAWRSITLRIVAGIFRTVRFGDGRSARPRGDDGVQFLSEQGAIVLDGGRYRVDYAKMPAAIERLARELLEQEAAGDRGRAEAWFGRYNRMPPALTQALAAAVDVPVDIDPIFSFAEPVR